MITKLTEEERQAWKEAYTIHEKYHDMGGTEEEWTTLVSECAKVSGSHQGNAKALSECLLVGVINALERSRPHVDQITMDEVVSWT